MWTAPGPQEVEQRADRIACDHMSGLLMRSHMTAAKMGFATWVPNSMAVSKIATGLPGVSHVSDRSIAPSAPSRASSGLSVRR